MPKAEQRCPTVMAVTAQIPLTIGIPVGDDTGGSVCNAIFRKQLLQNLVRGRGKARLVLSILMTFPPDVPTLIIFQVIGTGGKVPSSSIAGLPLSILQDLLIDDGIICKLSFHLNVSPPGRRILYRIFHHCGTIGGSNAIGISTHILG